MAKKERLRACWCFQDGTAACDTCTFKVYYPQDDDDPVQFFEPDEDDYYPV